MRQENKFVFQEITLRNITNQVLSNRYGQINTYLRKRIKLSQWNIKICGQDQYETWFNTSETLYHGGFIREHWYHFTSMFTWLCYEYWLPPPSRSCFQFCLVVCSFVSRITEKWLARCTWNFMEGCSIGHRGTWTWIHNNCCMIIFFYLHRMSGNLLHVGPSFLAQESSCGWASWIAVKEREWCWQQQGSKSEK